MRGDDEDEMWLLVCRHGCRRRRLCTRLRVLALSAITKTQPPRIHPTIHPPAQPQLLATDGDVDAAVEVVDAAMAWRKGEGKAIVDAASAAVAAATAGGGWDK